MHTRKVLGKVSTGLEAEKSQPGGGALKTTPPTSAFKSLKAKNVLKAEICWVSFKTPKLRRQSSQILIVYACISWVCIHLVCLNFTPSFSQQPLLPLFSPA